MSNVQAFGITANTLTASTISTTNLSVSGSINGALNINGFTTMSNVQAFGINANSLTASNAIQGDVVTGRVIQATENLTAPLMTLQNLNVQQVATISTGVVSSFFTNFINNLPYPPQSGITGATPSTIFASTINVDGGLNVTGATTNSINNVNISSMSSVSIKGLLTASTLVTTAGMTNTGGLPIITSNLSAVNINNVLFINGQVYPPPVGSVSLQSTLFLSSVFVNGGLNMSGAPITLFDTALNRTNGNIFANSGTMQIAIPEVGSPGGSAFTITAGSTLASTLMFVFPTGRSRFTSSMFIRDPVPVGTPSQAYLTTYIPGSEAPAGSVITGNVSTNNLSLNSIYTSELNWYSSTNQQYFNAVFQNNTSSFFTFGSGISQNNAYLTAGNIRTYFAGSPVTPTGQVITSTISSVSILGNNITTNSITATTIDANTMNATLMTTANINVSSINNIVYPPPGLTPIGAITIWAGGSDDGGVQNFNVPAGWLVCDGSEQDKLEYANLFGVIGQKYAMNKPLTGLNFYLPDLTFAVPMGTPFRNYNSTIETPVQFQVTFETWKSDFVNPASTMMQTWLIRQTIGGTLNYGTLFPSAGFTLPSFPDVYVSQILSYDGNQGYVVVRSVNNSPIPSTGSNASFARANGTVAQDASGTYLYTLGSYNANSAYPQVTRNQKQNEVYPHTHTYSQLTTNSAVQNFLGTNIYSVNAPGTGTTGYNTSNTISTLGIVNTGTYTAPNFINMLYIIKY